MIAGGTIAIMVSLFYIFVYSYLLLNHILWFGCFCLRRPLSPVVAVLMGAFRFCCRSGLKKNRAKLQLFFDICKYLHYFSRFTCFFFRRSALAPALTRSALAPALTRRDVAPARPPAKAIRLSYMTRGNGGTLLLHVPRKSRKAFLYHIYVRYATSPALFKGLLRVEG